MFRVTRRVDTNIKYQIAVEIPCAESREQNLECRGDRTMICIADRECLFIIPRGRALGAVIVIKFQTELDIADERPIAMNHRTKINEARWR